MKEIFAIVRMNMMNKTKNALSDAGISSMTAKEVLGRGKGLKDYFKLLGQEGMEEDALAQFGKNQRLVPKRLLIIVVPDELVPVTVKAILSVNQTGKPGDGKIFVLPALDACRIRISEVGDSVLDEIPESA